MVVEARGDTLKVWVNGDLVNEGTGATAQSGQIALQAEGTEVEFRKVEIGPLPEGQQAGEQAGGEAGEQLAGIIHQAATLAVARPPAPCSQSFPFPFPFPFPDPCPVFRTGAHAMGD